MEEKYTVHEVNAIPDMPWEVIGPDSDGGPYCYAACATLNDALFVANALNLREAL